MPVCIPNHVARRDFVHDPGDGREVRGDVMLEAIFADVALQLLRLRNFHRAGPTESFQRIICESAFTNVAANDAVLVFSGKERETHRCGVAAAQGPGSRNRSEPSPRVIASAALICGSGGSGRLWNCRARA